MRFENFCQIVAEMLELFRQAIVIEGESRVILDHPKRLPGAVGVGVEDAQGRAIHPQYSSCWGGGLAKEPSPLPSPGVPGEGVRGERRNYSFTVFNSNLGSSSSSSLRKRTSWGPPAWSWKPMTPCLSNFSS